MATSTQASEIYMLTNLVNGKKYIGQAKVTPDTVPTGAAKRFGKHISLAKGPEKWRFAIHHAIAKHGEQNFIMEVLLTCNTEHADQYETDAITMYDTMLPRGYNMVPGGTLQLTKELVDKVGRSKRKLEEDRDLPPYIFRRCDKGIHVGYTAHKKGVACRSFVSSKKTLAEKLAMAKDFMQTILQGGKPAASKYDTNLPKNISHCRASESFQVVVKKDGRKIVKRQFGRSFGSLEQRLQHAKAFVEELKQQGIV